MEEESNFRSVSVPRRWRGVKRVAIPILLPMRILFVVLLLVTLPQNTWSQSKLDSATERLMRDEQLDHATLGIAVIDLETGSILKSLNSSRSLVPASLMKLTTTATALDVLGESYRFETQLCYTGTISGGVLAGNIYIVGGGDPSLGAGRPEGALELDQLLERWVAAVARAGINRIEGEVIGDESLDAGAEPSPYWQWNDIGNYYGAGPGALMINENKYTLKLERTPEVGGKPRIVGYEPDPGKLQWINQVSSASPRSGDNSYIFGAPGTYDRVIRGTIPAGRGTFRVKGSLPQPALHAAEWLTAALEAAGIDVQGAPRVKSEGSTSSLRTLDTYQSPPLVDLVEETNHRSLNLYAEAFYAALGRAWEVADDPESVGERLVEHWSTKGINTEGWEQVDGAGLAMRNMITPMQLAQVLRVSKVRATLPRVGEEGTVRSLLRGNARAQRIQAKSGTLKRARGLAGYATMEDGREVSFVVLANNFTGSGSALRLKLGEWMRGLVE